jgi:hypothetical protein
MLSSRSELADDACPISDKLLGELYRANDLFVPGFVSTLAPVNGWQDPRLDGGRGRMRVL